MSYKRCLKVAVTHKWLQTTAHSNYHNLALHLPQPSHTLHSAKPPALSPEGREDVALTHQSSLSSFSCCQEFVVPGADMCTLAHEQTSPL